MARCGVWSRPLGHYAGEQAYPQIAKALSHPQECTACSMPHWGVCPDHDADGIYGKLYLTTIYFKNLHYPLTRVDHLGCSS